MISGPHPAADWYDGGKWLQLQYHTRSNSSDAVEGMWRVMWTGIQECNSILDKIPEQRKKPQKD
jgi:hypothetical protein